MATTTDTTIPLQISIPTDILCIIFDILRRSVRNQDHKSSSKFDRSLHWVPEVTHICSSWREAALSVSFLWTHIHIDASVSWAVEFARRSGNAPIRITACTTPSLGREGFACMRSLLHENRQRVQGIYLKQVFEDYEDKIIDALSNDTDTDEWPVFFPILDDLEISSDEHEELEYIAHYSFELPDGLLHTPELKALSLTHCAVAKEFGTFDKLSHLYIRENTLSYFAAPFLRDALSNMPNLETLDLGLEHPYYPANLKTVNFGTQLDLPKLLRIKLHGWRTKWITSFLQAMSPGPQRTIWVTGIPPIYQLEQYLHLFSGIMSHTIQNSAVRRLTLAIDVTKFTMIASQHSQTPHDDDIRCVFRSPETTEPRDFERSLLDGLLRRTNHQDLQILRVSLIHPLSTRSWVEFFGKLPSLTSISISSGEIQLFAALIDGSKDAPVEANLAAALPFQALREVRISRKEGVYAEKDKECMLKCLRKRMDLGMSLKKLSFVIGYGMSNLESQINVFRDVVTQMDLEMPEELL